MKAKTFFYCVLASVVMAVGVAAWGGGQVINPGTSAYATNLLNGALGSIPYQTGASTTGFVASPTTSGHTFAMAWQPSGAIIAPAALDVGTYLASPPAIGGSSAAAGTFTTLKGTSLTLNAGSAAIYRCSTGTSDGQIVVSPSTAATACTVGGGSLVSMTLTTP
jgi:hypothetical protein